MTPFPKWQCFPSKEMHAYIKSLVCLKRYISYLDNRSDTGLPGAPASRPLVVARNAKLAPCPHVHWKGRCVLTNSPSPNSWDRVSLWRFATSLSLGPATLFCFSDRVSLSFNLQFVSRIWWVALLHEVSHSQFALGTVSVWQRGRERERWEGRRGGEKKRDTAVTPCCA